MSGCGCDSVCGIAPADPRYRRALVLNALMFFVGIFASVAAQPVSLLDRRVASLLAMTNSSKLP